MNLEHELAEAEIWRKAYDEIGVVMMTLDLRCPTCGAPSGRRCLTATGHPTSFHKARPNEAGFSGRDDQGRQFCLTCERWKFPAIHSCPGVPQLDVRPGSGVAQHRMD